MNMLLYAKKSNIWKPKVLTVSYMVHYDTLLQNMTDIIAKYGNYFITKSNKDLLQNSSGVLLQNVTVLLQNSSVITK